ncbi:MULTISPECIES: multicopper oxidase family protein [unclassified Streptomyces]|uniref:multicopper oxidase family protein n=1 Tax=unclassified Streptomyces TaxID=2593676 RepID=UPI002E2982B8|nr:MULTISPECIES: multicopper oxidase family protein [unclassified Streptomyces]WUB85421.1 multicopper oxidase family protein [Streptomyces sp. NBC_00566]
MHTPSRRTLLRAPLAAAGAGLLAACSDSGPRPRPGPHGTMMAPGNFVPPGPAGYVEPSGPEVRAAERRRGSGRVRMFTLTAGETTLDLGGRSVRTWAYQDALPGPLVRATAGDVLSITLANRLPETTTLHSHGVRLRCDMDGAPGLTQESIPSGMDFNYRFTVADPGTYLLHSHVGMQPDRGLYAPLVVDDPREPLKYDKEWVIVLDDWVDGVDGSTPEKVLEQLKPGGGMAMMGPQRPSAHPHEHPKSAAPHPPKNSGPNRMLHGPKSRILDGVGGNVSYPIYLINGRRPGAPTSFKCRPGERIRLRIINAGSDTAFRVALGGHKMTVTHTDGYPVRHRTTDALLVGMAERYDVLVTAKDGVFPLVALAEGKGGQALAVLRTDNGRTVPPADVKLPELDREVLPARRLQPDDSVALDHREPDREMRIRVTGTMEKYDWGFDHKQYDVRERHAVRSGERVRMTLVNATDMWHPLHLHGHTFALTGIDSVGARKDTAVVLPHRKLVIDFDADNPGLWMLHCHNQYHSESGMMTILGYKK